MAPIGRKCSAVSAVGRSPAIGQQLTHRSSRMSLHTEQDVREIFERVDRVLLARGDERVEDREVVASLFVADEEVVRSPERDASKRGLGDVVVRRDGRVAKKASEFAEVTKQISDRAPHRRAWLEGCAVPVSPPRTAR